MVTDDLQIPWSSKPPYIPANILPPRWSTNLARLYTYSNDLTSVFHDLSDWAVLACGYPVSDASSPDGPGPR